MKHEKWLTFLTGTILSFLLSFACAACVASAFDLHADGMVDMHRLVLCCVLISLLASVCCTWRLGWLVPCVLTVLAVLFWHYGSLESSIKALSHTISARYHQGYGWKILDWSDIKPLTTDRTMALQAIGSVVAMFAAWTVCGKHSAVWALIAGLLPLILCTLILSTVPSEEYLFLWLLSQALLLLSQTTRRRSVYEGNKLMLLMFIPIALALILLFHLMPKDEYTGRARAERLLEKIELYFNDSGSGESTDAEVIVDLANVGRQANANTAVMDVTVTHTGTYYLRGRAYDIYTGMQWEDSGTQSNLLWQECGPSYSTVTVQTRNVEDILYFPYYSEPMEIQQVSGYLKNEDALKEYSFTCYRDGAILQVRIPTNKELQAMTQLPPETLQWAKELSKNIIRANDGNEKTSIADYVRNSASYDLDTPKMDSEYTDFAQWFLTESDAGYCVHFATATTVLLRAAGIPARYVTGYMVEAVADETVIVYQRNAHAWVEYWSPYLGWQILDPTPAAEETIIPDETESVTEETTEPETTELTEPTQETTEPPTTTAPTESVQEDVQETTVSGEGSPTQAAEADSDFSAIVLVVRWFVYIALVLLLIVGQWRVRLGVRKRSRKKGSNNIRALKYWRQVLRYATAFGEEPDPTLQSLVLKARFSHHTLTRDELLRFEAYIQSCIEKLRCAPWYRQIYHRIILALY